MGSMKDKQNQGKQGCSTGKKTYVVFLCCSVCSTSVPFLLDVVSLSVPQFSHLENGNINPCFPEEPGANSFSVAAFTCFMS